MEIALSGRETEILKLVVSGMTSQAIADSLCISLFTVRAHRRNIMEKTNASNTAELIAYAIRNGLMAI